MRRGWVGLDVGTSSGKAVVYGDDGVPLAEARVPTAWETTRLGVEIAPAALLAGAVEAANLAVSRLPDDVAVAGIGVTSMGETGVLVDGRGEPVAPAIAWHDTRDDAEVHALGAELGDEAFRQTAGKPLRGQFSLTKHRWSMSHDPAVRGAVRRFNVAEWVARGLGADEACDRVLACRTGWFDLAANRWWPEALAWSGADSSLMPPLVSPGAAIGTASAAAAHTRLRGAVVTLAGHDHQAAALGVGATGDGDQLDSCGTAEALVRTVPPTLTREQVGELAAAGITTDVSVRPGRWSLLGGTEGGLAMQRTLQDLGVEWDDLGTLDEQALENSSDATGPGQAWLAVVDAACADAARLHDAMNEVTGPHQRIVAAGGWTRSRAVVAARRARFGRVDVSEVREAGTLGAAVLAARAAGVLRADERLGEP